MKTVARKNVAKKIVAVVAQLAITAIINKGSADERVVQFLPSTNGFEKMYVDGYVLQELTADAAQRTRENIVDRNENVVLTEMPIVAQK